MFTVNNNLVILQNVLNKLKENKLLDNFILIGSWCEYFYEEIYLDYESQAITHDIDFLIRQNYKNNNICTVSSAIQDFDFSMKIDSMTGKTVFYDDIIEIEFLSKYDRNHTSTINYKNLGVVAECIGSMDLIERNTYKYYSPTLDIEIELPTPSVYVVHKILINSERSEYKAYKDATSIDLLLSSLLKDKESKEELKNVVTQLSKKQKKQFLKNAEELGYKKEFERLMDDKTMEGR